MWTTYRNQKGSSEKESKEEYYRNRVRRIEALVNKAGVTLKEYETALSFTKSEYKAVI